MKSSFGNNSRLCVERLEDRTVPSGCQAFGQHLAALSQVLEPNLGAVVAAIADRGPGAVAAQVAVDFEVYC